MESGGPSGLELEFLIVDFCSFEQLLELYEHVFRPLLSELLFQHFFPILTCLRHAGYGIIRIRQGIFMPLFRQLLGLSLLFMLCE